MKVWIVWLPNIGKSTLFNALTKSYAADAANFPFCTIEPNVWIVEVRDPRIDKLSEISNTQKKVYATIEFVDIAWLVKWAGQWEGLGNKFLSHIREVNAIVQVLRYFSDTDVTHVEWAVDPLRDREIINTELMFADLQQLEKAFAPLEKKAKTTKDALVMQEYEWLRKAYEYLKQGVRLYSKKDTFTDKEFEAIRKYNFLSLKPIVYALNVSQEDLARAKEIEAEFVATLWAPVCVVCAKLESEMMEFSPEERKEYLSDLVAKEHVDHVPTLDDLIALAFKTVGLMYYFTTGEKETRAWTIPFASKAPQAAGAIHTDFERWFIKAEVVSYENIAALWSWNAAKEKWLVRLEWKEYVVQDWDVMVFKFNV